MLPPTVENPKDRAKEGLGWRAVTDAPLSKWDQVEAYDTAAKCEAAKAGDASLYAKLWGGFRDRRIRREAKQAKGTDPAASAHTEMRKVEDDFSRVVVEYRDARCVPAEAVYPPHPAAPK